MQRAITLMLALHIGACASIIDEDFEGYVAEDEAASLATPTHCNPANPQDASGRFAQCASDETCQFVRYDGTADPTSSAPSCIQASDWKSPGASCSYLNECGPGGFCSTSLGCMKFCELAKPACTSGQACLPLEPSATAEGHAIGFCAPTPCDPVGSGCAGTCGFYAPDKTACFVGTGSGEMGEACSSDVDCVAGLGCDDKAKRCTPYCRIGSDDCGANECVAVNQPPLSYGGSAYGYCAL